MDKQPQLRGERLRGHIVASAKEEFLESGYDATTMDAVAARAHTSKRSLYAHFPSKNDLFLAVLDLIEGLYLDRLGTPEEYAEDRVEAVTMFCARFLQLMTWEPVVRTTRLSVSEAGRRPEHSRAYFEALIGNTTRRLAAYLAASDGVSDADASERATRLIEETVLPQVLRTLMKVDPEHQALPDRPQPPDQDAEALRARVRAALAT